VSEGCAATTPLAALLQAFPRISKLFQRNSKEIPNFSKDFQTFSLAVSWEIKELSARRAGNWISWTFSFGWSQIYSGATNPLQLLTLHGRS
jgi:hypothetical protein